MAYQNQVWGELLDGDEGVDGEMGLVHDILMRFKCGSNLKSMGLSIGGVTVLVEDDFGDKEDDDEEAIDGDDDDLEGVFQGLGLGAQGGGGRRGHGTN